MKNGKRGGKGSKRWKRKAQIEPRLISGYRNAGRYVGKSESTVRRILAKGEFPQPFLFGDTFSWERSDLDDYIDQIRAESAAKLEVKGRSIRQKYAAA